MPPKNVADTLQPYVDSHTLAGAVVLWADKDRVLGLETGRVEWRRDRFRSMASCVSALMVSLAEKPLTGEPDAGNPPVRFGGRGGANHAIPTPIALQDLVDRHF